MHRSTNLTWFHILKCFHGDAAAMLTEVWKIYCILLHSLLYINLVANDTHKGLIAHIFIPHTFIHYLLASIHALVMQFFIKLVQRVVKPLRFMIQCRLAQLRLRVAHLGLIVCVCALIFHAATYHQFYSCLQIDHYCRVWILNILYIYCVCMCACVWYIHWIQTIY